MQPPSPRPAPRTTAGILNVGGGSGASLIDVINIAQSLTGRDIQVQQTHVRNGDVLVTRADPRRIHQVLGWQPAVDLPAGMRAQMQALAQPAYPAAA